MKRQEEINIAKREFNTRIHDENLNYDIRDCFEEDTEWAESNPKSPWISVEDRLPENCEDVFVCYESPIYGIKFYDIANLIVNDWVNKKDCVIPEVIYWMPIPKLPNNK